MGMSRSSSASSFNSLDECTLNTYNQEHEDSDTGMVSTLFSIQGALPVLEVKS